MRCGFVKPIERPSFAAGEKERVEPANTRYHFLAGSSGGTCVRISLHVQNINMADETHESCSFHEMGLDDRLVKVNIVLEIEIDQNRSF